MNLNFMFGSGKNPKLPYYLRNYAKVFLPKAIFQKRLTTKLDSLDKRKDVDYIRERVDYYNKMEHVEPLDASSPRFKDLKKGREVKSVYFLDAYDIISWFKEDYNWHFMPGDITFIPEVPSIVKSRPIEGDNRNSVILKLVKVRHFIFIKDKIPFQEKENRLIFRGKVDNKPNREAFMKMYFGHPMCDLGNITKYNVSPSEWKVKKSTLFEHLKYKFILALEGNDVASNLKWVMSSNSIAVMPQPKFETWFMEGRLKPNYHYIKIKDDYSDLEERINYYLENEGEALEILKNAQQYVSQFFDKEREHLIGLAVMEKYLKMTGQKET